MYDNRRFETKLSIQIQKKTSESGKLGGKQEGLRWEYPFVLIFLYQFSFLLAFLFGGG